MTNGARAAGARPCYRPKGRLRPLAGLWRRDVGASIATPEGVVTQDFAAPGNGPFALFLDVDGTLLDLAERPSAVSTPSGLVPSLTKAERKLRGALALVSGRRIKELDRLFAPLRLRASGVHGAEVRIHPDHGATSAPEAAALPSSLWTDLTEALREFPGTFAENKIYSFAIHYRLAPDAEAPLRRLLTRLVESERRASIEVVSAHCALELKARGFDKGSAIEGFLSRDPFLGRTPIFIGDDATDEAGFAVVAARGGYAYAVGPRRPGTLGAFDEPRAVRDWLAGFAEHGGVG